MELVDQIGQKLNLETTPKRIVSTVPSQTELLFHLGLEDQLVGRTRFCIHPKQKIKGVKDVGGTKQLKLDVIDSLKPDFIIANKEENDKEQILKLKEKYPVYISDIVSIKSALQMIRQVGQLCGTAKKGNELAHKIEFGFSDLPKFKGSVLYLIWYKPFMGVGEQTFINEMLDNLGFQNALSAHSRYPELTAESIKEANPDYVFLSSEPFPFKQKHIDELQEHLTNAKIILVDGEMFSWYGNRMLKAIDYFHELFQKLK